MTQPTWNTVAARLIVTAATVGLLLSIYEYVTPLTGINGSFGAILVCASSLALAIDGLCLGYVNTPSFRILWLVLGFLGAIGTLAAGFFLHLPSLMGLMAVVLIALVINLVAPPRRSAALQG